MRDPIIDMIEKEKRYANPSLFQSFLIINSELDYLNEGLKRKDLDKRLLLHLKESKEQIFNNKKTLENSYQSGKLSGKTYLGVVEHCLSDHLSLFKNAKDLGDKAICARLAKRLDLLTKEKSRLSKDPINEFVKLMKFINPKLEVDPSKKFASEVGKPTYNAPLKVPKIESDYSKKSNEDLEEEQIDSLPLMKRILFFKKRHKQYHNLTLYYSKNVRFSEIF